jgi:hypothetical protein
MIPPCLFLSKTASGATCTFPLVHFDIAAFGCNTIWNLPKHKPHTCFSRLLFTPAFHTCSMYCNDEMLRIIGRTVEHVIGRSSKELEGIETEAKVVGSAEAEERGGADGDQNVYMLDIIDASGFLHKGSAVSSKFSLVGGEMYAAATLFHSRVSFRHRYLCAVGLYLFPFARSLQTLTRMTGSVFRLLTPRTRAKAPRQANYKCRPAKSQQP